MIEEGGLYVLMGSKPMSTFRYHYGLETDEEFDHYYRVVLSKLNNAHIKDTPYEELKKEYLDRNKRRKKLWHAFKEKIEGRLDTNQYLFVLCKSSFNKKKLDGLFINVPNFLFILKQHYADFAKIGGDFDPETMLNELSNVDSPFWEKVFQDHYLQGLLFGYGDKNSFIFSWLDKQQLLNKKPFTSPYENEQHPKRSFIGLFFQYIKFLIHPCIEVSELTLPQMRSMSLHDEVLEKYRNERKAILKEFKGKDFVTVVMQWLEKKEASTL